MKLSTKILFALGLLGIGGLGGAIGLGMLFAAEPNNIGGDPITFDFETGVRKVIFDSADFSAAPASNSTALVMDTDRTVRYGAVLPSTFIGGSGTDEVLVMWDGTTNLQDVTGWKGTSGILTFIPGGPATGIVLTSTGGNTRLQIDSDPQIIFNDASGINGAELEYGDADGRFRIDGSAGGGGLYYSEDPLSGTNVTGFFAPDTLGADFIYELPDDTPADGEQLTWTTGGDLEWQAAGGSGGGYDTIEDEGTPLTQRTTINFTGAGVSAADVGGETVVTISGGGSGMTDWDMDADSGTAETVADGEIAQWLGGDGLKSTVTATRIITYVLDLLELTGVTDYDPDEDGIAFGDSSGGDSNSMTPKVLEFDGHSQNHIVIQDEFMHGIPTTAIVMDSPIGDLQASGTAAGVIDSTGSANMPGVQAFRTGTTTTGRVFLGSSPTAILLGGGAMEFRAHAMAAVESDGTNRWVWRLGFGDSPSAVPVDGVFFEVVDNENGGEWQAICRSNNVETATDTNIAFGAAVWHEFKIIINANATSVDFILDGNTFTITTNIPTGAGRETGLMPVQVTKSTLGTSSRQAQYDYAGYWMELDTPRF